MKKFKTYGKYRTATNIKSDEWDELKKIPNDNSRCGSKINCKNVSRPNVEDSGASDTTCDVSVCQTTRPLNDVTAIFENLSIDSHSTPITFLPDVSSKSDAGTPLKGHTTTSKRTSQASKYSFTCKRFVNVQSYSTKNAVGKKISGMGNISLNDTADEVSSASSLLRGNISFKEALSSSISYSQAERKILNFCEQDDVLSLDDVIGANINQKIGEGSYGEVYLKEVNGELTAVKIVPVGEREEEMKYDDILPEIAISKKLSNWKLFEANKELYPESYVQGFVELKRVSFCKGSFTRHLTQLWEEWKNDRQNDCQNEHPDVFDDNQKYVVFENSFGGQDLEKAKITTVREATSILKQLVATLASAESSLQLEHRDLHWGNILIKRVEKDKLLHVLVDGQEYEVASCGVSVSIIDFTLARLVSEGCAVFTDLSNEQILFNGEGDQQFDVYRQMKEHNKNEWESFNPYTNVLWVHYVTLKLASKLRKCVTIKKFATRVLEFNSCSELLLEDELFR